jgi:hypothetical protein
MSENLNITENPLVSSPTIGNSRNPTVHIFRNQQKKILN